MAVPVHVPLPKNKWVEVTDRNCVFQNRGETDILVTQSVDEPTSTDNAFIIPPKGGGSYTTNGDSLWAYSCFYDNCSIVYQEN